MPNALMQRTCDSHPSAILPPHAHPFLDVFVFPIFRRHVFLQQGLVSQPHGGVGAQALKDPGDPPPQGPEDRDTGKHEKGSGREVSI